MESLYPRAKAGIAEKNLPGGPEVTLPSNPLSPAKRAEVVDLAPALRAAVDALVHELAAHLATTDDAHLVGDNQFKIQAPAPKIAAQALEPHLRRTKRLPRRQRDLPARPGDHAAEFQADRAPSPLRRVGPVPYRRVFSLCRRGGEGLFPLAGEAGLTTRNLTPARERVAPLAGAVAESFEQGAELLSQRAGVRLGESTGPAWPWPDEEPLPLRAWYLAGLSPLEDFGPLLRKPPGLVGLDRADRGLGLTDGGNGLEDWLRENFPRLEAVLLDFSHPAEKLTGLAWRLHPADQTPAEEQARRWRRLLKEEGGAVLGAVLQAGDWPRRAGLSEAVSDLSSYLERQAHRRESPA